MSASMFCGTCGHAVEITEAHTFAHACRHGDKGHGDHVVPFSISAAQRDERFPKEPASA